MSILAERVLKNEEARHGNARQRHRLKAQHRSDSIFDRSIHMDRHPLDRRFRCGFDPHNITIKQYRLHIANCKDGECIGRHLRWLDLMEYFRK